MKIGSRITPIDVQKQDDLIVSVKACSQELRDQCVSYQWRISRSQYAYFTTGCAYLRVGPVRLNREVQMAVSIANVIIDEEHQSKGEFNRLCAVAAEFAQKHGLGLIHENVGEPRLCAKHERDGLSCLDQDYVFPSYFLRREEVALHNPYKEKVHESA